MLKKVYVLSEEERVHRELVRTRRQFIEHRSDVAKQIKSKLLFHGIESPWKGRHRWTRQFIQWLRELTCTHKLLRISLGFLIDLYEHLTEQLKEITKQVFLLSTNEKYAERIKLLLTIPGIGRLIAIEILVELQDMKRFKTAEQVASYIGLTPSEYSTGQYIHGRAESLGVEILELEPAW